MEVGYHVLDYFRSIHGWSFNITLQEAWGQMAGPECLNGRSRSSQHHAKSGLKGKFKVLASNTLFPSSLHHLSSGWIPHGCTPVSLSAHPAPAWTPPGPSICCASQMCTKEAGIVSSDRERETAEGFWPLLACALERSSSVWNLGLKGNSQPGRSVRRPWPESRIEEIQAETGSEVGLREEWSPKDRIPCAQHLPVHSIREEERINISVGSGGHWEWSWETQLCM